MKNKIIGIAFLTMILVAGCGNADIKETAVSAETTAATQETTEAAEKETVPGDSAEVGNASEGNAAGIYVNADSVAELTMGANENGSMTSLCTVKVPTSYIVSMQTMNAAGSTEPMKEMKDAMPVSYVLENNVLKDAPLPAMVALVQSDNAVNGFVFQMFNGQQYNVESEKSYASDGVVIGEGSAHPAYIYETTGAFPIMMVYEVNDNWSLFIEQTGTLKGNMSLEEIGQKFYDLVTVLN